MNKCKVAILMTCFNRLEKTKQCLVKIFNSEIPNNISIDFYLVDDGSTDGTYDYIKKNYPEINLIRGTGSLYWSGGMFMAWNIASSIYKYDYYLWINNDTFIYPNSLQIIFSAAKKTHNSAIITGSLESLIQNKITYGGVVKGEKRSHIPNGELTECEIINGNFVLIPNKIFRIIGNIDPLFRHAIGDHDYGLRAINSGFKCYVTPIVVGVCEVNDGEYIWRQSNINLFSRLRNLYSPLGYAEPFPYFIYICRHYGFLKAIKQLISMHIRVVFPKLWN